MGINTNGEKDYRTDLYERTAERFGVSTKSGGIDAACEFSTQMFRNLERAAEHEDMTEDLAEVLWTANVTVENYVETLLDIFEEIDPSLPRAEQRVRMREHVRSFSWSSVANFLITLSEMVDPLNERCGFCGGAISVVALR